jgi:class 3 adenylate cyclase/predicted ATPase
MRCSNCGAENEAGRKFCGECGTRLELTCTNCGAVNSANMKFCGECGMPLAAPAAAGTAAPAADEEAPAATERRLVSVLFVDLVGFTTLSERHDAEQVREAQSGYFATARTVVERYGGTIEKFIGDAVVGVWGAPVAQEDDAERAVRAGLDVVDAVAQLSLDGTPLQARAGVVTGEAAVAVGQRGEGMVTGDIMNTAARLQSAASAGSVLVGESTYRATSRSIGFEAAGKLELKGKAQPVTAWRATQVVAKRGGAGRSEVLEAPFVGRDAELRQLKELFHSTAEDGRARLVVVNGQAGIGKSRLAWEFEKYLDGLLDTIYWHEGRSPAYGEGISFWALGEMVRQRALIAETDDPATAAARLEATVAEFVTDPIERKWIEPRLAGLLGLQELPTTEREELFAAWRTFFERISERAPTVMVFTDLQWADTGLLDFIEGLVDWLRGRPILVMGLTRPELHERRPGWGTRAPSFAGINLAPLSPDAMRELLHGLVPGLGARALGAIVERSEGIPLYAVETVRMLIDRGQLERDGERFRLTVAPDAQLGVPETLHALIAARIDATAAADRALLLDAAILGQSFTLDALEALTGEPRDALTTRLSTLVASQLLSYNADPRSPERGQYQFLQGLVREVAHQSLSRRERKAKHLAAARHYESLGDEELSGVLASHYLDAYLAAPEGPEAAAVATQARIALRAAADRAVGLHSYEHALAYLERALEIAPGPEEEAALRLRAAEAGAPIGAESALGHADRAREIFTELGDERGALRAATQMGFLYDRRDRDAVAVMEEAIGRASELEGTVELAYAHAQLARAYMIGDQDELAVTWADRALAAAGPGPESVRLVLGASTTKGPSLLRLGRWHEAKIILRGAIDLAERHELVFEQLRARNNLASALEQDRPDEAVRILSEGLELARRYGEAVWMYQMSGVRCNISLWRGDWDRALAAFREVVEQREPPPFYQSWYIWVQAWNAAFQGRRDEGDAFLLDSERIARGVGSTMQLSAFPFGRAIHAFAAGEWTIGVEEGLRATANSSWVFEGRKVAVHAAIAAGQAERAEQIADDWRADRLTGVGFYSEALQDWLGAGIAALRGEIPAARAGYLSARKRLADLGQRFDVALLNLEFGSLLGDAVAEAREAAQEAEAVLTELDIVPFLEAYRARVVHPRPSASPPSRGRSPKLATADVATSSAEAKPT